MTINVAQARANLQSFQLQELFINDLGWNNPSHRRPVPMEVKGINVERREIANLSGVAVFEIKTAEGNVPDEAMRRAISNDITELHRENLLIFLDAARTSSVWYWVKRDTTKASPRSHTYVQGQSGDVLIGKLSAMFVDMSELDAAGNLALVEAARKVKQALDVEPVTKKFFQDFQGMHRTLLEAITGVADERDRRWYASVLLNRLMFVYFLQRRGFLRDQTGADDLWYLQHRLDESQTRGADRFYNEFLRTLFFEGFAKHEPHDPQTVALIGHVRYLNGGLFLQHQVEQTNPKIAISDAVFHNIFELFQAYDWSLDDSPGGNEKEINPAVLGYIFEKYINQKAFGAYYTRTEITEYLCEQTIHRLILDKINETLPANKHFASVGDLLLKPTPTQLRVLLRRILPDLRLIDPACGSGAFLVAAMRTLISIYSGLFGKAKFSNDAELVGWVATIERDHPNIDYYIRKQIITNNLFGVDIMAEATEIARLRLFLALVAAAGRVEDLEPLPNIDFNILAGNSLIGLLHVDEQKADAKRQTMQQLTLFETGNRENYRQLVAEKNRLVTSYRNAAERLKGEDANTGLQGVRDQIQDHRKQAADLLDALLLDEFTTLGIKYEQATWDEAKNKEGKPKRRPLTIDDICALQPFHWGYEFDEVMNERGGFDAIITNPPWEIFKPIDREFAQRYDQTFDRRGLNAREFQTKFGTLLEELTIRTDYLEYLSDFPHTGAFFRASAQYKNQGGGDVNLYKLFTEQCLNLLRQEGQCGIVIPSGIYSDLGTKALREMLFGNTKITGLFCFENRREVFEGVHRSFKFVVLTFTKSGQTRRFPAAFMRLDAQELQSFPSNESVLIEVELVRRLSPDSLSITEFKSDIDIIIATKMLQHPLLGEAIAGKWKVQFANEFHMTADHELFHEAQEDGMLPLYEGKMIWHFEPHYAEPRYWVHEKEGRKAVIGSRGKEDNQQLDYQQYRFACRSITGNTNERTMICCVTPKNVFCGNSLQVSRQSISQINNKELLFLTSVMSSFVVDFSLRQRVATQMNMFYVYQTSVPRLTEMDAAFAPIVERAAKLICTTPEYDELAAEVGLGDHTAGVTDAAEREQLRAELDALVAHLYRLTEEELTHILGTFPLVKQRVKDAVLTEFHRRAPNPDDVQVAALVAAGESDRVEFKESAMWNMHTIKKETMLIDPIVKAVAAFLNDDEGGSVFIGVNAKWQVVGIAADVAAASPKNNLDDYERAVRTALSAKLGGQNSPYYRFSFHTIGAQQVLRIAVSPAPDAVYVDGDFYIRDGGGKKKLNAQQAMEYVKHRWRK